ncbi:MAG TPA: hypothetical protein VLV15_01750, partial [Dongiaceae bacterium]|nr:hypothetical protein [Dongiaceae bacterium]
MSDPTFSLAPIPDPHWWQRAPDVTRAPDTTGTDTERANAALVEADTAGAALPFWALMGFTFVLLIAPQNIFPALRPLRLGMLAAATA